MRTIRASGSRQRRGGVLAFSLVSTMMIAVFATCMLQISGASIRRQSASLDTKRAFYVAEAGLAEAYSGLSIGKTGNVGSSALPAGFGEGLFWVEATELDADHVQLDSTGMCGLGRAEVSMVAERGEQSVASLGMFSHTPLSIPAGARITGYDSTTGEVPVAPQPAPPPPPSGGGGLLGGLAGGGAAAPPPPAAPMGGRIGSNNDITVTGSTRSPTIIHGDLSPGPDETVTLGAGVTHVGSTAPRLAAADLPPIEAPFAADGRGIAHSGAQALVIPAGERGLAYLDVASGAEVVIQGPCEIVLDTLTVASQGELRFDTQLGAVSVWLLGGANLAAGSVVSTTGTDPSQMTLQSTGEGTVAMMGNGGFHGVIYAPSGLVQIGAGTRLYGAAVAEQLVLSPGAQVFFDQHLDEVALDGALPKLVSWRLVELSSASHSGTARDPFTLLGVDRNALPPPAQAHRDQVIHLVYVGNGGGTRTYDGPESGFDWRRVREVIELTRDGEPVTPRAAQTPEPAPPPASAAMNAITDPGMSSSDLKALLLGLVTMTSAELVAVIDRTPAMNDSDLKQVLEHHGPLGSTELIKAIDRSPALSSTALKDVLVDSSPLPADVLSRVLLGSTLLSISDRLAVLGVN